MIVYNYLFRVTAIVFVVATPLIFFVRSHAPRPAMVTAAE
jgi:hypothetical protein